MTLFIDTAVVMYAGGGDHPLRAARDLVHVATCLQEGISDIVSPDRGFDSVPGIRRIDPADAATI